MRTWLARLKKKMLKQEYGINTEREERIVPNKIGIAPKKKTKQNKTGYGYF